MDCAKASFKETIPPYLSPEFLGVHGSINPYFPAAMVCKVFGNVSQGDICI